MVLYGPQNVGQQKFKDRVALDMWLATGIAEAISQEIQNAAPNERKSQIRQNMRADTEKSCRWW